MADSYLGIETSDLQVRLTGLQEMMGRAHTTEKTLQFIVKEKHKAAQQADECLEYQALGVERRMHTDRSRK